MNQAAPSLVLCPYCGNAQQAPANRCNGCGGFFDALSRKVSQQHMGPWYIRDANNPFRPGCSYETLVKMIGANKLLPDTIMRGPTTRQYWTVAWRVPGVSHLLGFCYACEKKVTKNSNFCPHCRVQFPTPNDRDMMGLDADDPTVMQQVQQARAAEAAAKHNGSHPPQPVVHNPAPPRPMATAPQPPALPANRPPAAATAKIIRTIPSPGTTPTPAPSAASTTPHTPPTPAPVPAATTDESGIHWEAPAEVNFGRVSSSLASSGRKKNSAQLVFGLVCINLLLILAVVIVVMIRNRDDLGTLDDNSNVKPPPQTKPVDQSNASPKPNRLWLEAFV